MCVCVYVGVGVRVCERAARLTLPEIIHFAEDLLVLDVAAAVLTQRRPAHGALQAARVPGQVVHLHAETDRQTASQVTATHV